MSDVVGGYDFSGEEGFVHELGGLVEDVPEDAVVDIVGRCVGFFYLGYVSVVEA